MPGHDLLLMIWLSLLRVYGVTAWSTAGHDSQHTGRSLIAAQHLNRIAWSTPVDLILAGTEGDLLAHYGTPIITAGNTVLVPVRTSSNDTFEIQARSGVDGSLKYTLATDYILPAHDWIPSYAPGLTVFNRIYYPCAGGTVCYRDSPDDNSGATGRIAFYGTGLYDANRDKFNATVRITTPIVSDQWGNIFFGFRVTGANPAGLASGMARLSPDGAGSWISAPAASGIATMTEVPLNAAPSLSNDQETLYFVVSGPATEQSALVAVSSTMLAPTARVLLVDPRFGTFARRSDNSSSSPVIGLDGDVYVGVEEAVCCINNGRGWMLHFDSTLKQIKTPGAFGWDSTPSIVPSAIVPRYSGTSSYLILTKYNNYSGVGTGDGQNRIAVLDPNTAVMDPVTRATVMKEVITILGPTPDGPAPRVKEWCINTAAIDVRGRAAMVNNEDGKLYRWDFSTNTFTEQITLTPGVGEAYTPTAIGPDGTVYAINDGLLFAVRG